MSASGSPHVAFEVPVEVAAAAATSAAGMLRNERLRLGVCFVGVFVCYFYYGILQESITRGQYGSGDVEERFRFAMSLVFVQCVISALFAKLVMKYVTKPAPDRTAGWLSAACAVSYLGAMVSSNSALQYVNYPTQVLGKSCKPIPDLFFT